MSLQERRAQGMPGDGLTHGPPAKKMQAAGTTGAAGSTRHSLRDGLHAYIAISPVSGLLATVVRAMREHRHELGASLGAPGPRNFTSARTSFVRTSEEALRPLAAIAPRLACRD